MDNAAFAQRLKSALDHLSPRQLAAFARQLKERGQTAPGPLGMVAQLAGLPTPSVLADLTAGRTPGLRHREALAGVLGVTPGWLNEGVDAQAPDWVLEPYPAWERFAERLGRRWQTQVRSLRPGEESSLLPSPGGEAVEAQRIARLLALPLGHSTPSLIAAGRFSTCTYADVERFAIALGQAEPTHPEHLVAGQSIARIVEVQVEQALSAVQRKQARFLLPPRLFSLARLALAGLKAQRSHQSKAVAALDDCLEVLWRQQLVRQGASRRELPAAFTRDTGRTAWTALARIQGRYDGGEDPGLPFDSQR